MNPDLCPVSVNGQNLHWEEDKKGKHCLQFLKYSYKIVDYMCSIILTEFIPHDNNFFSFKVMKSRKNYLELLRYLKN